MSPKRLAKLLKDHRAAQGLTQVVLAKRAKVTQAYIAKLETGEKKNPSLAILQKLARALGVPITELLG
jgi:transcriptional regulator with XRE-family HTH domain